MQRLADCGALVRVARGLYADPDAPMSAQRSLAEVARAVPKGTVCLPDAFREARLGKYAYFQFDAGLATNSNSRAIQILSAYGCKLT